MTVFFFHAEDGIRDGHVTGVQTCALPISFDEGRAPVRGFALAPAPARPRLVMVLIRPSHSSKIGRASCRERVLIPVVAVAAVRNLYTRCCWKGGIYGARKCQRREITWRSI